MERWLEPMGGCAKALVIAASCTVLVATVLVATAAVAQQPKLPFPLPGEPVPATPAEAPDFSEPETAQAIVAASCGPVGGAWRQDTVAEAKGILDAQEAPLEGRLAACAQMPSQHVETCRADCRNRSSQLFGVHSVGGRHHHVEAVFDVRPHPGQSLHVLECHTSGK